MERLGLSKAEIARKLGVTRQAVNYYFRFRPIGAAVKFAKLFNLNPKDLIV